VDNVNDKFRSATGRDNDGSLLRRAGAPRRARVRGRRDETSRLPGHSSAAYPVTRRRLVRLLVACQRSYRFVFAKALLFYGHSA